MVLRAEHHLPRGGGRRGWPAMTLTTKGEIQMTASTIPATIHIRPSRFVGLLVAVATLAAAVTWVLVTSAIDARSAQTHTNVPTREQVLSSLSPTERQYVTAIASASPLELAAAYGTSPIEALGLTTTERQYVEAIAALSPEQLAAGYGTARVSRPSSIGRDVSTSAAVLAELTPSERDYVEAIIALTPEQLAADFGTR